MHYLIALIYFLLALIGLDSSGSHTIVTHSAINGVDVLYSKTRVVAGTADFACISSESGRCHYRLWPSDCSRPQPRVTAVAFCDVSLPRQFVLAAGARRQLAGMPANFTLCVSHDRTNQDADCESTSTRL